MSDFESMNILKKKTSKLWYLENLPCKIQLVNKISRLRKQTLASKGLAMKGLAIVSIMLIAGCSNVPKSEPAQLSHPDTSKPIHALVAETLINPPQPAEIVDDRGPYLSSPDEHLARIEKFSKNHPTWVEREKIIYLFDAIKQSPYTFVREETQYTGDQAARFLRWKMGRSRYLNNPIRTARDFIDRVIKRYHSNRPPYEVIFPDGTRLDLTIVLEHELASLDAALTRSASKLNLEHSSSSYKKPSQTDIAITPLMTAGPSPTK